MPAYLVQIDPTGAPIVEGNLNAAVFAEDAAAARLAAASLFNNDQNTIGGGGTTVAPYYTALWAAATVTEIVAGDLEGAILRVRVNAPTPIDVSVTGAAAATVDDIGALMVTALNLDAQIAGAAYSAGNLLTVSDIADALGDLTLQVDFTLNGESLGAFVGAIVHEGIAAAVLTVQLATDAIALPNAVARW